MNEEEFKNKLQELQDKIDKYERPFKQKTSEALRRAGKSIKRSFKKAGKWLQTKGHNVRVNANEKWREFKHSKEVIAELRAENEELKEKLADALKPIPHPTPTGY